MLQIKLIIFALHVISYFNGSENPKPHYLIKIAKLLNYLIIYFKLDSTNYLRKKDKKWIRICNFFYFNFDWITDLVARSLHKLH